MREKGSVSEVDAGRLKGVKNAEQDLGSEELKIIGMIRKYRKECTDPHNVFNRLTKD